jgi:hypothetical protein
MQPAIPFTQSARAFIASTTWTFARTFASTWPHEYVVQTSTNAPMILALARHIFTCGIEGRFYSQVRRYHHEDGWVYWCMSATPEEASLINRCHADQTYEARLAAGTLPSRPDSRRRG